MHIRLLVTALIFMQLLHLTNSEGCETKPVKEGTVHTMNKSFISLTGGKFVWKKKKATNTTTTATSTTNVDGDDGGGDGGGQEEVVVVECDSLNLPSTCTRVDGEFEYILYVYSDGWFRTSLTIASVTRPEHETVWSWYDGDTKLGECDMEIYARDTVPVCDKLQLSGDGETISWTCGISRVYPKVEYCRFYYMINNPGWKLINFPVTTQLNQTEYGDPPYYDVTCSLEIRVFVLRPGSYIFQPRMPDHIDLGNAISETMELALPQTQFRECLSLNDLLHLTPNSILVFECQCVLADAGNPPGRVQWVDQDDNDVGRRIDDVTRVTSVAYIADSGVTTKRHICRGVSPLGKSDLVYDVNQIEQSRVTKFDANSETHVIRVNVTDTLTLTCDAEGNPMPRVKIVGERSKKELFLRGMLTSLTSLTVTISKKMSCNESDTYICTADNGIGPYMHRNVTVLVEECENEVIVDKTDDSSSDLSTPALIAICVGTGLLLCVVFFLIGRQVERRRMKKKTKQSRFMGEPPAFTPRAPTTSEREDYDELYPTTMTDSNSRNQANSYLEPHRALPDLPPRDPEGNWERSNESQGPATPSAVGESGESYVTLEAGSYTSEYLRTLRSNSQGTDRAGTSTSAASGYNSMEDYENDSRVEDNELSAHQIELRESILGAEAMTMTVTNSETGCLDPNSNNPAVSQIVSEGDEDEYLYPDSSGIGYDGSSFGGVCEEPAENRTGCA